MASVHDVAAALLPEGGEEIAAMKLHRLCHYARAWHLVWEGEDLFPERVEAWAAGPAIPALYEQHKGQFVVDQWPCGSPEELTDPERETVAAIMASYGNRDAGWISELAKSETPWLEAREGLPDGQRGSSPISNQVMLDYYAPLAREGLVV